MTRYYQFLCVNKSLVTALTPACSTIIPSGHILSIIFHPSDYLRFQSAAALKLLFTSVSAEKIEQNKLNKKVKIIKIASKNKIFCIM